MLWKKVNNEKCYMEKGFEPVLGMGTSDLTSFYQ